jgi:bacillithiol biosynthesis cysteine-adding enzyme BshC
LERDVPAEDHAPTPASLSVDLLAAGRLSGLPAALLGDRDSDLLAPARWRVPGALPATPPALSPDQLAARARLAGALAERNADYGHPRAAALAERLAQAATQVVVTGQQPGILGGPLYTLTKAMAAANLAAALERQGQPAVAVFWIASEDHDWAEATWTAVPTPQGARRFDLGPDPEPLTPLGLRRLGDRMPELLAGLAEAVPGERYAGWLARLGTIYHPQASFGEAFARLMVELLGPACPLLVDAMDPALKRAEVPWLERLIDRRAELAAAQEAVEAQILARGHRLQVAPQAGASPLFLLDGRARRRIAWDGPEGYHLRGGRDATQPVAALRALASTHPERLSPGVLARPAVQDAVFGTSLLVLGPGEVAYLPQVAPAYATLEIATPAVVLRPQALVLDRHQREHLADLARQLGPDPTADPAAGLLADLLAGREIALANVEHGFVAAAATRIASLLDELAAPALALDPALERALAKTRESVDRALEAFAGRVAAAAERQGETRAGRLARLREVVSPLGELQERVVSSAHFPGKFGAGFVAALAAQLGDDPRLLSIITPETDP